MPFHFLSVSNESFYLVEIPQEVLSPAPAFSIPRFLSRLL